MPQRTVHAFTDELAQLDAVATAEAVRAGRIQPREVVAAAIARAQALEPSLHAIATEDYDRAVKRSLGPATGPFAGVPTVIKDLTDVAGLPTRNGSEALHRAGPAQKTCRTVRQMFDMGMICLGKSTLCEFGFAPSTEFPNGEATRNPWNVEYSTGGSSGGSAALVAAGVVPIAHAVDGGGSIRIPAACCGLVGLKPTRGRLLAAPEARWFPVDSVAYGVLSRSVRDTALFFSEAEKVFRNPNLPPMGLVTTPPERRLRIGAIIDTPMHTAIDAATRRVFDSTLALLEDLGHHVESIPPPVSAQFAEDFKDYYGILAFAVTHAGTLLFGRHFDSARLTDFTRGFAARFTKHPLRAPGVIRRLRKSGAEHAAVFRTLDVLISPTVAHLPPRIGHLGMRLPYDVLMPRVEDWVAFTPLANATGAPSISVPLGYDADTNLPIGMMFGAAPGHDGLLLQLALELEGAKPWRAITHAAGA
jgi:amidase